MVLTGAAAPLVVAHRGSSLRHPEHTLAAYASAIEEGADGLECDVRLTRDGHLVCVHDRTVDRTSNGRGVVSEFALSDLNRLDFGSWGSALPDSQDALVAPDYDPAEHGVLTLDRLLEVVVDAGPAVRLFVETKHPTRYAGLVEQQLVRLLRRFGLADPATPGDSRVIVMSFAPIGIRRVRLLAPTLPTLLLMERVAPFRRDGSLPTGVRLAGPGLEVLRAHPRYVARAHEQGNKVYVWTVDEPADIDLVLSLGVDAIATNRPLAVRARLNRT